MFPTFMNALYDGTNHPSSDRSGVLSRASVGLSKANLLCVV